MKVTLACFAYLLLALATPIHAEQRNTPVDAPFVLEHMYWLKPGT